MTDSVGSIRSRRPAASGSTKPRRPPQADALAGALSALVSTIEALSSGAVIGSVLLLDEDLVHLRHGAAPHLPAEFVAAIDGSPIGPAAGSCGTAAFRREAVIVEDIDTDPLWMDYRELAREANLRACWSTPIFSDSAELLGTFAMYSREPRAPTADDLALIDLFVRSAALTIVHARDEKALRATLAHLERAHADLRFVLDVTTNAVAVHDTDEMLGALAQRAVARLACTCIVDVLEHGVLRRVATATSLRRSRGAAAALADYTPTIGSGHPIAVAAVSHRTRGPNFIRAVEDAGDGDIAHLQQLEPGPFVCIPLQARDATVGVLTLLTPIGRPDFDDVDIDLANDLAGRIATLLERNLLHEAARAAEERLSVLSRAGELLTGSLRVDAVLGHLFDLTVPGIGDIAELHLLDDQDGPLVRFVGSYGARGHEAESSALPPVVEAALERCTTVHLDGGDPGLPSALRTAGVGVPSWVTACPLVADARPIGVVTVAGFGPPSKVRSVLPLLAARGALALDNAQRLARERSVAEVLQRSLLPRHLPVVAGLDLAACYHPGARGAEVGGDWYDIIRCSDGRTGIVMGDVMGRGIPAAIVMGTIRNALHAFAIQDLGPAQVLDLLTRLVEDDDLPFATVLFGIFDPKDRTLTYASAGHCPAVAADSSGVTWLDHTTDPPVGVPFRDHYREHTIELAVDTTVVLYTDGLIERRDSDLDHGLRALHDAVQGLLVSSSRTPKEICDGLIEMLAGDEPGDDVAVMAVRVT